MVRLVRCDMDAFRGNRILTEMVAPTAATGPAPPNDQTSKLRANDINKSFTHTHTHTHTHALNNRHDSTYAEKQPRIKTQHNDTLYNVPMQRGEVYVKKTSKRKAQCRGGLGNAQLDIYIYIYIYI